MEFNYTLNNQNYQKIDFKFSKQENRRFNATEANYAEILESKSSPLHSLIWRRQQLGLTHDA